MAALGLKLSNMLSNAVAGAIEAVRALTGRRKDDGDDDDHAWRKPLPTDRTSPYLATSKNLLVSHLGV